MKKITLMAASVALALGLVACDKAPQTAAPETAAVAPAKTLVSGVEKENFDAGVKHT